MECFVCKWKTKYAKNNEDRIYKLSKKMKTSVYLNGTIYLKLSYDYEANVIRNIHGNQ